MPYNIKNTGPHYPEAAVTTKAAVESTRKQSVQKIPGEELGGCSDKCSNITIGTVSFSII